METRQHSVLLRCSRQSTGIPGVEMSRSPLTKNSFGSLIPTYLAPIQLPTQVKISICRGGLDRPESVKPGHHIAHLYPVPQTRQAEDTIRELNGMAAKVQPSASLPDQVGLHATKAIPPGSEITSIEKPLLAVVDLARLDETCSNCFKWIPDRAHATAVEQWLPDPRGVTLSKCLGCSTVKYCDKVSSYLPSLGSIREPKLSACLLAIEGLSRACTIGDKSFDLFRLMMIAGGACP